MRVPTAFEALPFTPLSSIVPFNPGMCISSLCTSLPCICMCLSSDHGTRLTSSLRYHTSASRDSSCAVDSLRIVPGSSERA